MKKILVVISMFAVLSGCEYFSKLNNIEYNNKVVEQVNLTSTQIEKTASIYNTTVPTVVTESTEISAEEMSTELSAAQDLLKKIEDLYILESKNADQQAAVLAGLEVYKSKSEAYLAAYEAMNTYYGSGEYKTDVSKVTDLDENIHTTYSAFIEENNTLVGVLDSFVESET
ncbi:MAG: hypothetical protein AAB836_01055 [Patescibacteria group bacterium]|mgnify:CR=1 FL=1